MKGLKGAYFVEFTDVEIVVSILVCVVAPPFWNTVPPQPHNWNWLNRLITCAWAKNCMVLIRRRPGCAAVVDGQIRSLLMTAEHVDSKRIGRGGRPWRAWGPYLSERQWGTVREDYSAGRRRLGLLPPRPGALAGLPLGRGRLAGISDDQQRLCFALALWNGHDPILKERLFGLTNSEGNHGEDVKEYYFYLDSTPTHSYLKCLYKYPQAAFPYDDLVATNAATRPRRVRVRADRHRHLRRATATSTSSSSTPRPRPRTCSSGSPPTTAARTPATLHLLPTLWFRNTWSWATGRDAARADGAADGPAAACVAEHAELGDVAGSTATADADCSSPRTRPTPSGSTAAQPAAVRQGRHQRVRRRRRDRRREPRRAREPRRPRTTSLDDRGRRSAQRAAAAVADAATRRPGRPFGRLRRACSSARRAEADEFYATRASPGDVATTSATVMRQALAGMLWSKQYYYYDVDAWLRRARRAPAGRRTPAAVRNARLVPHGQPPTSSRCRTSGSTRGSRPGTSPSTRIAARAGRPRFRQGAARPDAARVATCIRTASCRRTSGTSATSTRRSTPGRRSSSTSIEKRRTGDGDLRVPGARVPASCCRTSPGGSTARTRRAQRLPGRLPRTRQHRRVRPQRAAADRRPPRAGRRDRLDGAVTARTCSQIALELAAHDPVYEDMADEVRRALPLDRRGDEPHRRRRARCGTRRMASSTTCCGCPTAARCRCKVRSMVGLLPLCAATVIDRRAARARPRAARRARDAFIAARHPDACRTLARRAGPAYGGRRLLSLLDERPAAAGAGAHARRGRVPQPVRHPVAVALPRRPPVRASTSDGQEYRVDYLPAESDTGHVRRQLELARARSGSR